MLFKVILTFAPVDEILEYHYSLESYIEQYFPVMLFVNAGQGDSNFCVCG